MRILNLIAVFTFLSGIVTLGDEPVPSIPIAGNGINDDAPGIQALLDSGAGEVRLPKPKVCYLIGNTLRINSNQTLKIDRDAVIKLKPHAAKPMLSNSSHEKGNENISVEGGIWNMDNLNQPLTEYQKTRNWKHPYEETSYIGILMRFDNVKNLRLASLTLKDPVTFGMQLGRLRQFTIEDIVFDYNLKRSNMDGVHLNGDCRKGFIRNLTGATNDDMLALNADDGTLFEMTRGPIEDISVDGLFAENGYTAVRLLSAGSPIRRIKISGIFGTYRVNVVSFTNHKVHPGEASTFDDVTIDGVFASKTGDEKSSPIWIASPAKISSLTIRDYHRIETAVPVPDILIDPQCRIENLNISDFSSINKTSGQYSALDNNGDIGVLNIANMFFKAEGGEPRGALWGGNGKVERRNVVNVSGINLLATTSSVK
ncbi:MAG: hypothetical protein WCI51_07905 [Lentisphaerota bacterium]